MAGRTVTKKELCERIAANAGCTQVLARAVVKRFMDEIENELAKGNRIELRDFGVLDTRVRAAHNARNPKKDEPVHVPARAVVHFKVGKRMAEDVQQLLPRPSQ
ncbi:MAG: HU family DNA-binding protein [Candidatus Brocadiia bacterium]|nr:HU family DNA-binding protein [Candidatus Brocadiia bacterium]